MTDKAENYTVGWICAIPIEHAIACELLDEEYPASQVPRITARNDSNLYTFGRIHEHNVVIACLPQGRYGTTSAALVAERMQASFPALRFGLLVGIAGGAPSDKHDIRLGDVVVSSPTPRHGGVIQYDFGKALGEHKFEETGHLAPPPEVLLTALATLTSRHIRYGHKLEEKMADILRQNKRLQVRYGRPDDATDKLKGRNPGEDNPAVHHGLVASANRLMKDRKVRDALIEAHDILCFEMEAAGVMNSFPCLVVRGICDYSDAHKDDLWQGYAAATASAYAKGLLEIIPGKDVKSMQTIEDMNSELHQKRFDVAFSLVGMPVPKNFVERTVEMQRLQQTLLPDDRCCRRLAVLRGLGGIGKTQLAVEFARRHKTDFSAIGWLDADNEEKLKQSMVNFASRISIDLSSEENHLNEAGNTDAVVAKLLSWLSDQGNDRWLLIFDNVDRDVDDPTDALAYDVRQYFPSADHGSILITTRLVQLEQLGHSQEVNRVNDSIAQDMLVSWYPKAIDTSHHQRLLDLLDGLPLAIAQAGAYLQQSGMHIAEYIRKYKEKQADINKIIQNPDFKLKDYPDRNVWTTWTISYEAILKRNKNAAQLLLFWSFFDRNDFWHGLFTAMTSCSWGRVDILRQQIGDAADRESSFLEAIQLLRNYSLVEGSEKTDGYTMHAVVHRWTYLYQTPQSRSELGLLAIVTLGTNLPHDNDFARARQRLRRLPHAQACYDQIYSPKLGNLETIQNYIGQSTSGIIHSIPDALTILGLLFARHGRFVEAEQLFRQVAVSFGKTQDNKDISVPTSMISLATLYMRQEKFAEAEQMYKLGIASYEETLGCENDLLLTALNNMGIAYTRQGKFAEAGRILQHVLVTSEAVLGQQDKTTLRCMNYLGYLYMQQGELAKAEHMFRLSLSGHEETLGYEHASTLDALKDLAILYKDQGRHAEAEQMLLQVLQGYATASGPDYITTHDSARRAMWELGDIYSETRPSEAKKMFSQVLHGYRINQDESSDECVYLEQRLKEVELLIQSTQEAGTGDTA